jgi:3',5'-cyclic AMP phosphodiesterase CpdA
MIIDCISDLHGYKLELTGGDLLIVAGDLTARHTLEELNQIQEWLANQNYKRKIVIAGNHDTQIQGGIDLGFSNHGIEYLEDSGTEFKGIKIWGTPWSQCYQVKGCEKNFNAKGQRREGAKKVLETYFLAKSHSRA